MIYNTLEIRRRNTLQVVRGGRHGGRIVDEPGALM